MTSFGIMYQLWSPPTCKQLISYLSDNCDTADKPRTRHRDVWEENPSNTRRSWNPSIVDPNLWHRTQTSTPLLTLRCQLTGMESNSRPNIYRVSNTRPYKTVDLEQHMMCSCVYFCQNVHLNLWINSQQFSVFYLASVLIILRFASEYSVPKSNTTDEEMPQLGKYELIHPNLLEIFTYNPKSIFVKTSSFSSRTSGS